MYNFNVNVAFGGFLALFGIFKTRSEQDQAYTYRAKVDCESDLAAQRFSKATLHLRTFFFQGLRYAESLAEAEVRGFNGARNRPPATDKSMK